MSIGTATLPSSTPITKVVVGAKVYEVPPTAQQDFRCPRFTRATDYLFGFKGSTALIVVIRQKRSETYQEATKQAGCTFEKKLARL